LVNNNGWQVLCCEALARRSAMTHPDAWLNAHAQNVDTSGSSRLIPRHRTLDGFAREAGCADGVALDTLVPGTRLVVTTRNSVYQIVILDPFERRVAVTGGSALPERTEGWLEGTTAGGSVVRLGWIGIGLPLELLAGDRRIRTSPVRSITKGLAERG
jgi:hypothetical protein